MVRNRNLFHSNDINNDDRMRRKSEFHDLNLKLGEWIVANNLDKILSDKEIAIFKENNMSFYDLKLFGAMGKAYLLQFDMLVGMYKFKNMRGQFTLRNQIKTLKMEIFWKYGIDGSSMREREVDKEWRKQMYEI